VPCGLRLCLWPRRKCLLSEIKSGNFNHPGLKNLSRPGLKTVSQNAAPQVDAQADKQAPTSARTDGDGESHNYISDVHGSPPKPAVALVPNTPSKTAPETVSNFESFEALVEALPRESIGVKSDIDRHFRVVSFRPGHLRISKLKSAPPSLVGRAVDAFTDLTGELWVIDIVDEPGAETLKEKRRREEKERDAQDKAHPAFAHPLLKGAKLIEIRSAAPTSTVSSVKREI